MKRLDITQMLKQASRLIFVNQPIQWHLPTTSHDRCPRCGSNLGFLTRRRRACLGEHAQEGLVWELRIKGARGERVVQRWIEEMFEAREPTRLLARRRKRVA